MKRRRRETFGNNNDDSAPKTKKPKNTHNTQEEQEKLLNTMVNELKKPPRRTFVDSQVEEKSYPPTNKPTSTTLNNDILSDLVFDENGLLRPSLHNFEAIYPRADTWDPAGVLGSLGYDNVDSYEEANDIFSVPYYVWLDKPKTIVIPPVFRQRLINFKTRNYIKKGTTDLFINYNQKLKLLTRLSDFPIYKRIMEIARQLLVKNEDKDKILKEYGKAWSEIIEICFFYNTETTSREEFNPYVVYDSRGVDVNFTPSVLLLVRSKDHLKDLRVRTTTFIITVATNKTIEECAAVAKREGDMRFRNSDFMLAFNKVVAAELGIMLEDSVRFMTGQGQSKEEVHLPIEHINTYYMHDNFVETNEYGNVHFHGGLSISGILPENVYMNLRINVMRNHLKNALGELAAYLNVTHAKNWTGDIRDYIHKNTVQFTTVEEEYV